MLETLQAGGWSVWGGVSKATRAEELITELCSDASELLRAYSPLVRNERHAAPWHMSDHLIARMGRLMSPRERLDVLDVVLDHTGLMVGDAAQDRARFGFLDDRESTDDPGEVLFSFLLWLIDHPKWIRRDRAAAAVAWLLRSEPSFDAVAVPGAFAMSPGYAADVLCGVFESMSRADPAGAWRRVHAHLDLDAVAADCRHVSRLGTLHQIAERAREQGADAAFEVTRRIRSKFRSGKIVLPEHEGDGRLPMWADCIGSEWEALANLGLVSPESRRSVIDKVGELCLPLAIKDVVMLERAVCLSFRESPRQELGRWEATVRFALNCALFPYVSAPDLGATLSALRIYNPAMPDTVLEPGFESHLEEIVAAIREGNFAKVVARGDSYFLQYCGIAEAEDAAGKGYAEVEVVAVLVSASGGEKRPLPPSAGAIFSSTDLPDLDAPIDAHETCFLVAPRRVFFGTFTPGYPARSIAKCVRGQFEAVRRISWRKGRSANPWTLGRPVEEGCVLEVVKSAVSLPAGGKLAWWVRLDGRVVAIVDEEGRPLS